MPEIPDFDQLARLMRLYVTQANDPSAVAEAELAAKLRGVWNARGAADIAKLEIELPGPHMKALDRALRTLDR